VQIKKKKNKDGNMHKKRRKIALKGRWKCANKKY
jgi:hypothetical protein